jgi:rhamnosyl/mannosyltransferase
VTAGLHVVHVYKDVFPPISGGIERHIDSIRRALPDITSDVLVCSRTRRTVESRTEWGSEVKVGELGRALSSPIAPTFPLWLRRSPASIVHLHSPNPLGELSSLVARKGRPYVVSYHCDIVRQAALLPVYRPFMLRLLGNADAVIAGTRNTIASSSILSLLDRPIHQVPYSVDTAFFDPAAVGEEEVAGVRAAYGERIVVSVGRAVYYKGYEVLIEAAKALDASVVVVGGGPMLEHFRELAASTPNVHFLGGVTDESLRAILAAADVFVLASTSRAESFGIATLEAQSMGVPAIVTEVGTGTTEAIEPGTTGVVVEPGDATALHQAIAALLADDARRASMGAAARGRAEEHYSQDALRRALIAVYQAL